MKRNLLFAVLLGMIAAGCANVYVGGGMNYNLGKVMGAEAQVLRGISREMVIYPETGSGAGFYVELGKYLDAGNSYLSYTNASLSGKYLTQTYSLSYNNLAVGGRFFFDGDADEFRICVPVDLYMQWLSVPKGAFAGGVTADASLSGFGADAGLGAVLPLGKNFFLNADALWRFDFYSSATAKTESGKIEESIMASAPAIKAGINIILPDDLDF